MKLNKKLFNTLIREPDIKQEAGERTFLIYFMNQEEEAQFKANGKFTIWSTDGKTYKLLIDKEYYEFKEMKKFYDVEINNRWAEHFDAIGKLNLRSFLTFLLPILVVYIIVMVLSFIYWRQYELYIVIGLIVVAFIANFIQSRFMDKKFQKLSDEAQEDVRKLLGEENFNQVYDAQNEYEAIKKAEKEAYERQLELSGEDKKDEEAKENHEKKAEEDVKEEENQEPADNKPEEVNEDEVKDDHEDE